MRTAPKLTEAPRYPVIAGTALLSIGVTIAWWAKIDISPLLPSAMIRRGELWRLVTAIFPHLGILHLAFNVYWLWVFGTLVEEVYGHLKTMALILLFAVGSSALEFAFSAGGVGLSGVGYGLFGLLWVLSARDQRFHDAVDRSTINTFVFWFFLCIVTTVTKIMPVANIAHGAGAALGVLTGFAILRSDRRAASVAAASIICTFALWAATFGRPLVNLSGEEGHEEATWGYHALVAHRGQEAVRWLRDAVRYQPKKAAYWSNLGIAYHEMGNKPAGIAAFRKAADLGETHAQYYLGTLYESGRGGLPEDDAQALYWYRKAAAEDNAGVLNDVAWTYATSSNPAIRNPTAALECARKAVSLEKDHPDPQYLDTLAEAYYVNDRQEDAVKAEQQAIALASPADKTDFQKRLEKYQRALDSSKQRQNVQGDSHRSRQ